MRFFFCKIHCPSFIFFCKPSPHIYTAGPLKLENSPPSDKLPSETIEDKEESLDGKQQQPVEEYLKSSLRKPSSESGAVKEVQKKRVQWMDYLGKELVEIREFESSEIEDTDNGSDDNRGCVCVIL
ncbi:pollen-specific leucine-rich repeat extensin-like protein 1 [Fagus crenata]